MEHFIQIFDSIGEYCDVFSKPFSVPECYEGKINFSLQIYFWRSFELPAHIGQQWIFKATETVFV
jgi:hypothetical protein